LKRLAIYAHFDLQGALAPYARHHLEQLRAAFDRVVFVTTSILTPEARAAVDALADRVLAIPNAGRDFAMWRAALDVEPVDDIDELLLTNSSLYGPFRSYREILAELDVVEFDYCGATEGLSPKWHLQSFFLLFRKQVLRSPAFRAFWSSVLAYPEPDKLQVVYSYELGLSSWFHLHGFKHHTLYPYPELARLYWGPFAKRFVNPSLWFAGGLLLLGFPFLKVAAWNLAPDFERLPPAVRPLLRAVQRAQLRKLVQETGYDPALLQ
jgi:rhamnosyltransferase